MTDNRRFWFSIRGTTKEGWMLCVYRYAVREMHDGIYAETGAVETYWDRPRPFKTMAEVYEEIAKYE